VFTDWKRETLLQLPVETAAEVDSPDDSQNEDQGSRSNLDCRTFRGVSEIEATASLCEWSATNGFCYPAVVRTFGRVGVAGRMAVVASRKAGSKA